MEELLKEINDRLKRIEEAMSFQKKILTLEEGCKYLGYEKSYVYKLTSAGVLPFSKPNGKSIFFDRERLDEWILSNMTMSHEEQQIRACTYVSTHVL